MSEISNHEAIPPSSERAKKFLGSFGRWFVRAGLVASVFGAGMTFEDFKHEEAGPKNGITWFQVDGCGDNVDTFGPQNIDGIKVTEVALFDLQEGSNVRVSLLTQEMTESEVRDRGLVEDPTVALNGLVVACQVPLSPDAQGELSSLIIGD